MTVAMLSEYFLEENVTNYTKHLSYSLFIFPLISLPANFYKLRGMSITPRCLMALTSGAVFFIVGYLFILLLTKIRIELGLPV
jgi:hypothetical protein